jgi:hypothetical protein
MKIIICKRREFGEMWTCQYKCQPHLMLYLNLNETRDRPVFSDQEEKNLSKANFAGFYPPESGLGSWKDDYVYNNIHFSRTVHNINN